jgi:hypothetical protein
LTFSITSQFLKSQRPLGIKRPLIRRCSDLLQPLSIGRNDCITKARAERGIYLESIEALIFKPHVHGN